MEGIWVCWDILGKSFVTEPQLVYLWTKNNNTTQVSYEDISPVQWEWHILRNLNIIVSFFPSLDLTLQLSGFYGSPKWSKNQPGSWFFFLTNIPDKGSPQNIWNEKFELKDGLNATSLKSNSLPQESDLKTWEPPCSRKPSSTQQCTWCGLFVPLWGGTHAGVGGWARLSSHSLPSPGSEGLWNYPKALRLEVRRRRDQAVPDRGFSFLLPDYLPPCAGVRFAVIGALVLRVTIKHVGASPPLGFYCVSQ